jgi:hypothetical protein
VKSSQIEADSNKTNQLVQINATKSFHNSFKKVKESRDKALLFQWESIEKEGRSQT